MSDKHDILSACTIDSVAKQTAERANTNANSMGKTVSETAQKRVAQTKNMPTTWMELIISAAVIFVKINCQSVSIAEPFAHADNFSTGSVAAKNVDLAAIASQLEHENYTVDYLAGTKNHMLMHNINRNIAESDLRGKTLRVIIPMVEPPYVNYLNLSADAETAKGYGPGVVMEILREMSSKLNLTYDLTLGDSEEWGTIINGNWTGAFGCLVQGEADILAGAAIMQYDRSIATDLTYPFQYSETGMMIRSPDKYFDNTLLIVTEPFKWEVWGLTAVSIVISGLILKTFTKSLVVASEIQYTIFEAIWVFFSVFVQQGLPVQPKSWTCRTMLAFWWLASLTLIATFTGSLVALFAVDKTNMPFDTLEQMVKQVQRGNYRVVMDQNSQSRAQMIARSELQVYKDLWYEMKVNNRSIFVDGLDNGVKYVKQNKGSVLLGPMDALQTLSFIDCDVVVLTQGILPTYMSIPLQKDSMYSTYFSDRIQELVERGFIDKWLNDYKSFQASQQRMRCNSTVYSTTKGYLDLDRAQGAFWVLLAGIFLSASSLFSEHVLRGVKYLLNIDDRKAKNRAKQNGVSESGHRTESNMKTISNSNGHVGNGFAPIRDAETNFNTNGFDVNGGAAALDSLHSIT